MNDKLITEAAFRSVAELVFFAWRGFPASCSYLDFSSNFAPLTDAYGESRLGRLSLLRRYRMHTPPGQSYSMQVWYENDSLLMVVITFPKLADKTQLLFDSLGEPSEKIDYHIDVGIIENGCWVYPNKGISIFVDTPGASVMKVALYKECSLEHYRDKLHYDSEYIEFTE